MSLIDDDPYDLPPAFSIGNLGGIEDSYTDDIDRARSPSPSARIATILAMVVFFGMSTGIVVECPLAC